MLTKELKRKFLISLIYLIITIIFSTFYTEKLEYSSFVIIFLVSSGIFLGPKGGPMLVLIFILLGIAGVPVFDKSGGYKIFIGQNMLFYIATIPASALCGWLASLGRNGKIRRPLIVWASLLFSLFIVYSIGIIYYKIYFYNTDSITLKDSQIWLQALTEGLFFPYLFDCLKSIMIMSVFILFHEKFRELLPHPALYKNLYTE
jgi:biotin transporter BioY